MDIHYHEKIFHRASVVMIVLIIAFIGLILRLFWIQVVRHSRYQKQAFIQHWTQLDLPAVRGEIRDRNGILLGISQMSYSCYADPGKIKQAATVARVLSPILEIPQEQLLARIDQPKRKFVWLKRLLSKSRADEIRDCKLAGIYFKEEPRRFYPHGKLAAHVLGFVGIDHHGLEGIEASFSPELSGKNGFTWILKDGRLAKTHIYTAQAPDCPPLHGATVYLTLDIKFQYILESHLDKVVKEYQPVGACAILIEIKSGEILAMASRPDFDPNCFHEYDVASWRNLAIADAYELGSIMKPFIAAAALTEDIVGEDTIIFCHNGTYRTSFGRTLRDTHSYGNLSVAEVIIKSSNIGAAILGESLGAPRVYHYLTYLGFGKKTGISLPGEAAGELKPLSQWTAYTLTSVPMGHEICVTPLQMAAAYSVFGADGVYWPPSIVKKIVYANGKVAHRYHPDQVLRIYSPQVAKTMRNILHRVVIEGTAKKAKMSWVSVAGKTGTAQKYDKTLRQYSHDKHIAIFTGLAPADKPLFACLVMVNEPHGASAGGVVSAPVVAKILEDVCIQGYLAEEKSTLPLGQR